MKTINVSFAPPRTSLELINNSRWFLYFFEMIYFFNPRTILQISHNEFHKVFIVYKRYSDKMKFKGTPYFGNLIGIFSIQ